MNTEILEKTFTCPDSPRFKLSNIRGSVVIRSGEPGVITVKAVKHIESDNTHIQFSQSEDGSVSVETQYEDQWFRFHSLQHPCKVDYLVTVPNNCALQVRGVSNSAKVEGIQGGLDISSVSGSLECSSIGGSIRVKTVSGDFKGDSNSGTGIFKSVSADFSLSNCQFETLKLNTVSGDVDIETSLADGPYDFNSISGDIHLAIPSDQGVTVISSSMSGDVRTSSPISRMNRSKNFHLIEIEDGGVEINHHSISGDLIIIVEENLSVLGITRHQNLIESDSMDLFPGGVLGVN